MQSLIHLFAEDAWPLVWLIALAELVLVIAMVGTGRGRFLVWIAALAALAVLLVVVEWLWVTDRERVDAVINQIVQAVRQKDGDAVVRHLAPNCHYGNWDRNEIRRQVMSVLRDVEFDRITLSQRKTQVVPARKQATAEFLAIARGRQAGAAFNAYPTRWRLIFSQDSNGQWQVMEIQQLPIADDDPQHR